MVSFIFISYKDSNFFNIIFDVLVVLILHYEVFYFFNISVIFSNRLTLYFISFNYCITSFSANNLYFTSFLLFIKFIFYYICYFFYFFIIFIISKIFFSIFKYSSNIINYMINNFIHPIISR